MHRRTHLPDKKMWEKFLTFAVLFVVCLLPQGPSLAFQAIRGVVKRPSPIQTRRGYLNKGAVRQSRVLLRPKMASQPEEVPAETIVDPDRVRRRQLLVSMLAAASGSPFIKTNAAQAEETLLEEPSVTAGVGEMVDVIKPPLDDRDYVAYTLDNGLRVLLCSDPASNEAAAAMDVHVGACSDPIDVPGLAHFNEHMLFLGTKEYPNEDSFESFLATNGGSSNAYTASEDTVYFFDIEAEAESKLAEGLKRFGSFFETPLFTPSATGRELNAIESENAKNKQSDVFRSFQIAKSRANSNHPISKFFTGNRKTLLDDTKAKGIDLRSQLIQFYNSYYSSNQMTLAVVAPQSIDSLKKMVNDAFADIPNKNVAKPEEAWAGIPPFRDDNCIIPAFKYAVEVVPVQDLRQVTIAWPIVYRSEQERSDAILIKPTTYVAHLLGHEGPRSLLSYFKRRGWANALASASEDELSDFELFEVVVGLTSKGLAAIDDVIETVYSYISLLKDRKIPDYVFEEVLQLEELGWRFSTKGNVGPYAQTLATAMQKYPPALYIAGPRRLAVEEIYSMTNDARTGFSSRDQLERTRSTVEAYVDRLKVDNALVTVLSKTFENQTDQKEKWYGTDYRARRIPSSTLEKWQNPVRASKLKIDYPRPNIFVPSEAGLKVKFPPLQGDKFLKRSFESRMTPVSPPLVISEDGVDGRWKVYYKPDDRFGKPKAFIIFQVLTKEVFATPMRAALGNFFEIAVSDRLGEYAYDAGLAGLTYDVRVLARGVRLTFGGYNDKLKQFASYVTRKLSKDIRDLLPKSDNEFDRYKDQIMRSLSAFDARQPYAHASYYALLTLQPRRFQYSNKELRDETRKITLPDLAAYVNTLWESGKGEALIQGNVDKSEALDLVKAIGNSLPFKPIPDSEIPPQLEALPLPTSKAKSIPPRLLISEPNPFNENSVSYVMLQSLGKSERDHVLLELISAVVKEPFFNELRTKRQLGYIVSSGLRGIGDTRTLSFIVQSNVAPADSLTIEILKFMDSIEEDILQKVGKADLAVYIKSIIDRKTEPDKNLENEVTRNWAEIATGRLQFDRIQKEAAALLSLGKEEVIEYWRRVYSSDGRRILITEVIPRQGDAASEAPPTSTGYEVEDLMEDGLILGIDDIQQFRRDREKLVKTFEYA